MNTVLKLDSKKITDAYLVWLSDILEETISGADNFLDVGGNSMIAIALNSRLKHDHEIEIDLRSLFTLSISDAIRVVVEALPSDRDV